MVRGLLLLEACNLNPSAIIDLFQLDIRPCGGTVVLYFHSGNMINGTDMVFGGHEYAQWPVETKGLEWNMTSTQPRPTISFSNVLGPFTQMNLQYGGLVNAKLSRIRTFAKFLDGMPNADPTCYFPVETWNINRKTQEDREVCTYELANILDIEDVSLPKRLVLADQCRWMYRGDGCGYTGGNMADELDNPLPGPNVFRGVYDPTQSYNVLDCATTQAGTAYVDAPQFFVCTSPTNPGYVIAPPASGPYNQCWIRDQCSLLLSGCKFRFASVTWLPFGGFPGVRLNPVQLAS